MAIRVWPPRTRQWWQRNALSVAALVVVGAGSTVFLVAARAVRAYGWTAYTPLTSGPDYSRTSYLTGQHIVGAALVGLGLIMLAGAVGFRLGTRRRAT